MLNFSEFLIENTVAQELKTKRFDPEHVRIVKDLVTKAIARLSPALANKDTSKLANWLTYQVLIKGWNDKSSLIHDVEGWLIHDVIVGRFDQLQSKFNSLTYTLDSLRADNVAYHEALAKASGKGAEDGETILSFQDGYKWVRLPRGYCGQEGKAMGHCGNVGGNHNDRIFSLRDDKNYAYLTFIVNHGALGESKGRGNSKPDHRYYKYIIALLKTKNPSANNNLPYIGYIKGGGYLAQNNFKFEDLTEEQREDVLAVNPYINKPISYLYRDGGEAYLDRINAFINNRAYRVQDISNGKLHFTIRPDFKGLELGLLTPWSTYHDITGDISTGVVRCLQDYEANNNNGGKEDKYLRMRNSCLMALAPGFFDEDVIKAIKAKIEEYQQSMRPVRNKTPAFVTPDSKEMDRFIKGNPDYPDQWTFLQKAIYMAFNAARNAKLSELIQALMEFLLKNHNDHGFVFTNASDKYVDISISLDDYDKLPDQKNPQKYFYIGMYTFIGRYALPIVRDSFKEYLHQVQIDDEDGSPYIF